MTRFERREVHLQALEMKCLTNELSETELSTADISVPRRA